MTLTVEVGQGNPASDSYASVATCSTYAANHGLPFDTSVTSSCEAALRRATTYLDSTYRMRFPGYRTFRRAQALEWPRQAAYYHQPNTAAPSPYFVAPQALYPFDLIDPASVPVEIVVATCEAAVREMAEPGVLLPDLERGGAISLLRAGSVQVRYAPGASPHTAFQAIENALAALIGQRSSYTARASR